MTKAEWKSVNHYYHTRYQGKNENVTDPRWIERLKAQAKALADLFHINVFEPHMNCVDYGCGDGKLSDYFMKEMPEEEKNTACIKKYDKYMNVNEDSDYLQDSELKKGTFDVVITCSIFEHLIGRTDVNGILDLLSADGTFCLHTLVCEEVPQDPEWFYLRMIHCTLWTNGAMKLLFEHYGFNGCAYHVPSRMWFFFRDKEKYFNIKKQSKQLGQGWVFDDTFIDYWKQKPYREVIKQ